MQDEPTYVPATTDEFVETLSFALRYDGRRRVHHADSVMARIAAERLAAHLEQSGFVVMKKPPIKPHGMPRIGIRRPLTCRVLSKSPLHAAHHPSYAYERRIQVLFIAVTNPALRMVPAHFPVVAGRTISDRGFCSIHPARPTGDHR